ncbi:hypothetical protein Tco_1408888 [Tanacetum coccineum]
MIAEHSSLSLTEEAAFSSFLVSPSMKLLVEDRGGVGKGGSRVLIPDLVVMARVGASGSGVLLLSIAERILEYRRSDRILEGKDHCRCLLQTSIPARVGYSAHIHGPHEALFKRPLSVGCIASEMEEMFMEGDGSSHRSSWYWTYSSIRIHPSSSVREWKRN